MFGLFAKKPKGELLKLKISGMHCQSCAMSIDGDLEEQGGIYSSNTNYAKAEAVVDYDPTVISIESIKQVIEKTGYKV